MRENMREMGFERLATGNHSPDRRVERSRAAAEDRCLDGAAVVSMGIHQGPLA